MQQRAGAAGFAGLLAVGAPCPLCLHDVETLPEHHVSDDLERADAGRVVAATGALTAARRELQQAERAADELTARAEADRRALAAIDADLAGVPDDDTLREPARQGGRPPHARPRPRRPTLEPAEAAAAAHRTDPANAERLARRRTGNADVARLRVLADSHGVRRDVLLAELAGVPDEAELAAAIEEAQRLAGERHAAAAEHHAAAESAHDAAIIGRSDGGGRAAARRRPSCSRPAIEWPRSIHRR